MPDTVIFNCYDNNGECKIDIKDYLKRIYITISERIEDAINSRVGTNQVLGDQNNKRPKLYEDSTVKKDTSLKTGKIVFTIEVVLSGKNISLLQECVLQHFLPRLLDKLTPLKTHAMFLMRFFAHHVGMVDLVYEPMTNTLSFPSKPKLRSTQVLEQEMQRFWRILASDPQNTTLKFVFLDTGTPFINVAISDILSFCNHPQKVYMIR